MMVWEFFEYKNSCTLVNDVTPIFNKKRCTTIKQFAFKV